MRHVPRELLEEAAAHVKEGVAKQHWRIANETSAS